MGGKLTGMFKTDLRLGLFLFPGVAWSIWRVRNKMAIEKIFPNNPIDVIFTGVSYLQKWWRLLKPVDQEKLTGRMNAVRSWLNSYSPNIFGVFGYC